MKTRTETLSLQVAARKWDRMFADAVAKSIAKALTEPITNSWDSYKRLGKLKQSSGLVSAILDLSPGALVDHQSLVASLPRAVRAKIWVQVAAVAGCGLAKGECRVIDNAEGMTYDQLKGNLAQYGADKSGQGAGKPVRGVFGQGLADVLFGHEHGEVKTVKGDEVSVALAQREAGHPGFRLTTAQSTVKDRQSIHGSEHGTTVSFRCGDRCSIPQIEPLYARLCSFYMLRLINSDPSCEVLLEQYRSGGKSLQQRLAYAFPPGIVVGRSSTAIKYRDYPSVCVDWVAIRADEALRQDRNDDREGGFLVVDECDTVYDLTLFDFEQQPGLERLYGVVRLSGIRSVIKDLIDNHSESLILDSRDGFDRRKEFVRDHLWPRMRAELDPVVKAERSAPKTGGDDLSDDARKRLQKGFAELNALYRNELSEDGATGPESSEPLVFQPPSLALAVGMPAQVKLVGLASSLKANGSILLDSSNPDITVEPEEISVGKLPANVARKTFILTVTSKAEGARGRITAVAEGERGKSLSAELNVRPVAQPREVVPPEDGMEFRPPFSSSRPHRPGSAYLYIDTKRIPAGTEVHLSLDAKHSSGIRLISLSEHETVSYVVRLSHGHSIPGTDVARLPVRFIGTAKGQSGRVEAKAKSKTFGKFMSEAEIRIREPDPNENEGRFKRPEYEALDRHSVAELDTMDGIIYVNSRHPLNRTVFGPDKASWKQKLDEDRVAQARLADICLEVALFHVMAEKSQRGGAQGLQLDEHDPIGSVRNQIEEWRFKYGPRVYEAIVPSLGAT